MSFDYIAYWNQTYSQGGTSGSGSYGLLAAFKSEIINALILENPVTSLIEFGCGDGNQLQTMRYPRYLGLDVASPSAYARSASRMTIRKALCCISPVLG